MTGVFSGGLVYEYSQEGNNYGIVKVDGDSVTKLQDFDILKKAFEKTPSPSDDGGYKEDGKPSKCPPKTSLWEVEEDLPPMPDSASAYLENGAGKPRGTQGPSNQYDPNKEQAPTDTGSPGSAPTNDQDGDGQGEDDDFARSSESASTSSTPAYSSESASAFSHSFSSSSSSSSSSSASADSQATDTPSGNNGTQNDDGNAAGKVGALGSLIVATAATFVCVVMMM